MAGAIEEVADRDLVAMGDEEAATMGVNTKRLRLIIIIAVSIDMRKYNTN